MIAPILPRRARLKDKIAKVKQQMQALEAIGEQMKASEDGQISLTDPDARSMATSGRGTGIVGFNVQTAVDDKRDFVYDDKNDVYRYPAGRIASYRFTAEGGGKTLHKY